MNQPTRDKEPAHNMNRGVRWRRFFLWAFPFVFLLLVGGGMYAYSILQASRKMDDLWWNQLHGQEVSQIEMREAAHRTLRFPFGYSAYAFDVLAEAGDSSSVPYLLHSLRWQEHTTPNTGMTMMKASCLGALARITGHHAGQNYEEWKAWWDQVGSKLPKESSPTEAERLIFYDFKRTQNPDSVAGRLIRLGNEANSALLRGLKDESRAIRDGCIKVLFHKQDVAAQALPDLMQALNDTNAYSRVLAAWAIGSLTTNQTEAVRILEKETQSDDSRHSAFAKAALAHVAPERTGSGLLLLRALYDDVETDNGGHMSWFMHWRVIEAMRKIRFQGETEHKMLQVVKRTSQRLGVREAVEAALSRMQAEGRN